MNVSVVGAEALEIGLEVLAGGVVVLALGTASGEWSRVVLDTLTVLSGISLIYLIVFGSIVALTAYVWLLRVTSASRVATYAYVNPVVAVLLGHFVVNEPLTPQTLTAAGIILAAVLLVVTSPKPAAARQPRVALAEKHPRAPAAGLSAAYRLRSTGDCAE